ncbi:choloylglycine hydrolase [uncultured Limosilactobacillus sp.]|uniref:choloylglycine hydrolase n=1 Tax=uncultured Limosilactobacillus sp. TaxID=2837629 RepID=UPI0025F1AAC7|nr:choloylglycine hydrolase [uncultured Limosilactobacillus sp.]
MCTALSFSVAHHHYFGRNLDLELSYGQQVIITPRNDPFHFHEVDDLDHHYALIGVAAVMDDYPLYFDAANDQGLAMGGLNYPGNAYYATSQAGRKNVASFELIPWVLGQCTTIADAKQLLKDVNITNRQFSSDLPTSPLHWLVADQDHAIVIESDRDGIHIYDNPVGVLTNNPPFPEQLFNLNNYRTLSASTLPNTFAKQISLNDYSRGLGSRDLPGGMDAESRFVRATFNKYNAHWNSQDEVANITQLFHIMHAVEQPSGLDQVASNPAKFEYTIYTVGYNLDQGLLYYTTYTNNQINCVDMHQVNLEGQQLIAYPFVNHQAINHIN